jgi:hypothetical protein
MNRDYESFFRYSGYLVARDVVDEVTCRTLVGRVQEDPYPTNLTTLDPEKRRTRLEGVTESLGLWSLLSGPFGSLVGDLLGPNWVIIRNRHNHITMDYGTGTISSRLHRDSLHWSRGYLTAVVALQMPEFHMSWPRLIPGSHMWPIGAAPNGGGYWLEEDHLQHLGEQAVPVELKTGDVVFIDPLTFHGAGIGARSKPRVVLTLALRSTDELSLNLADNELVVNGIHSYTGQAEWARNHA